MFSLYNILEKFFLILLIIVPLLVAIAFYTLGERKALGAIHRRKGPNIVGFWGLLQPIADGLKLVIKEIVIPKKTTTPVYIFAPVLTFTLSLLNWAVLPLSLGNSFSDINLGLLYLLVLSGLGVYGIILSGWSSSNKYSLLGGLRAAAQMISYEISIGLCLVPVIMLTGTLNLTDIVVFQVENGTNFFLLFPVTYMFFISVLAETNRTPFDLPEAEAEIVAGYNLEYSGILFAMFFLGEYGNMILMSALIVILFFGGWHIFLLSYLLFSEFIFAIKIVMVAFLFVLIRGTLPRYRFDQLIQLGWKCMLPLALGFFLFYSYILIGFNIIPDKFYFI